MTSGPDPDDAPAATDVELTPDERCALFEDQLRRALADLDNLQKRFQREVARERVEERARVAAEWLPIIDDLERALQHGKADAESILEGVRVVYEHAQQVLQRLGYPRFEDVGNRFDPTRHEAVSTIDSDLSPGTVVAMMRPGYGAEGDVLRPAQVVVARSPG